MKASTRYLLILCLLAGIAARTQGQEPTYATGSIGELKVQVAQLTTVDADPAVSTEVRELNRSFLVERRRHLRSALNARLGALRRYRETVSTALRPAEDKVVAKAIRELEKDLLELEGAESVREPGMAEDAVVVAQGPATSSVPPLNHTSCSPPMTPSDFCLGAPRHRATNQSLELTLGWTEPSKSVQKYLVQLSEDPLFTTLLLDESVDPDPNISGGEFSIKKKHGLKPGRTYYWRVRADFAGEPSVWAKNGVFFFTTGNNIFEALSSKGFKLQKALTGPDKGELAEFSFLNTIGEKSVYSTTFALSWQPTRSLNVGRTNIRPGWSVEGRLASDESEAEDAWRFRLSSIFTTSFISCSVAERPCPTNRLTNPTFEGLYTKASLKFEGDKDFDVKKLSGEFLITPNSHALAIGSARPVNPSKPIQFQWRPFFSIDAGRTFRRGTSEETEETILRLVPRIRTRIDLQFLRQWLNLEEVSIFADDTFYYLPLEKVRKRNNFFTSGIEFNFTPNLGFGLTYKNGRSAPKFEKINTLQGVIGVRF